MRDFEVIFYRKPNGDCPVSDFIASLNKVMRFKMMHSLDLLELYGNQPKGDFSRFVEDGIFEARAQTRTDITRILFFFDRNRQIVLTNGFVKKSQRLPPSELELAKKYRADYLSRSQDRKTEKHGAAITAGPQWRPRLDDILNNATDRAEEQPRSTSPTHNKERGF